ncbi:MAG TPA: alpha/beta fold hydrolase [Segeticoccus sp.]|uniref:alpha/beta hydrolase n=1 Tax=Segeticoccus sp. TaxID=2706531 RepID=UPI002D810B9B|nr:alpha/beta fold hydrolase [Segeticoccus sp.]HET8600303.1 alpha/beta fold hydrolase [Segeticoccus sp.]
MRVLPGAEPFAQDGSRTGVLVCHGFTSTPQSMRPLARHLADAGYTVRLPRLPGHGTTWQDLNRTTWWDWYTALDSTFAELRNRCDRVAVVGLSMGGTLATRLAEEHGRGVAGLVLINPAYLVRDWRLPALPVLQHVLPSVPGIAGDILRQDGERELAYDRVPLKALRSQTELWRVVVRDLPRVTQPVLLLRSATDNVVPAQSSQLLLSRISSRDVTEIILERSAHVATLDHDAELVLGEAEKFIERVVGGGR